jgi:hypothetical protein
MIFSLDGIRRRTDGSIDSDFYVAIGQRERGRAVHALLARLFRRRPRPIRHSRHARAIT